MTYRRINLLIATPLALLGGAATAIVLGAQVESPATQHSFPRTLSETGLFTDLSNLKPAGEVVPYELNLPFWSDGASKSRWIKLPPKTQARVRGDYDPLLLPEGTLLIKHFERDGHRLETRVLTVLKYNAVDGVTYRWRPDKSNADRVDIADQTDSWRFMSAADCRTCHTAQAGGILGLTPAQLNTKTHQLRAWQEKGLLSHVDTTNLPRLPDLTDATVPIETRARAYLAVNCAQCHRPEGVPADLDLRFTTPLSEQNLLNAPQRLNLGIDNARAISPNDPWRSHVLHRIETLDGNRMPPLAHHRVDPQGSSLLREWIASLEGAPVLPPPVITAETNSFPITANLSHPDPAATVRYTLDGSAPTASSSIYTAPLSLDKPTTLRARAFREGHKRSITAQQTFTR